MSLPKKSLGQHWLHDKASLNEMAQIANVGPDDLVLEIGSGLGTLTKILVERAREVIAVELDDELAQNVVNKVHAGNLEVVSADILKFDLTQLPQGYKIVANIPYYLTSNLIRVLCESANPPALMALLVQKEVAQRIAAKPGQMSLLSVSVQLYYQPTLGSVVPAKLFEPPPKVDSQIVALTIHDKPLFPDLDSQRFFKIVKAGFSERRKKLRSSLSGGLRIGKGEADKLLQKAGIDGEKRAQELSLQDWHKLYLAFK